MSNDASVVLPQGIFHFLDLCTHPTDEDLVASIAEWDLQQARLKSKYKLGLQKECTIESSRSKHGCRIVGLSKGEGV